MIQKSATVIAKELMLKELSEAKKDDLELEKKKNVVGWRPRTDIVKTVGSSSRVVSDLIKNDLVDACDDKVRISKSGEQFLLDEESYELSRSLKHDERKGTLWLYEKKLRDNREEKYSRKRLSDGACAFSTEKFEEITFVHLREKGIIYACCSSHGVRDLIWLSAKGLQVAEYMKRKGM